METTHFIRGLQFKSSPKALIQKNEIVNARGCHLFQDSNNQNPAYRPWCKQLSAVFPVGGQSWFLWPPTGLQEFSQIWNWKVHLLPIWNDPVFGDSFDIGSPFLSILSLFQSYSGQGGGGSANPQGVNPLAPNICCSFSQSNANVKFYKFSDLRLPC